MRGSPLVARLFGIDVRVHFTFLFLLSWAAIEFGALHGARGAVFGVIGVVLLFACVTLHELGHSLVAHRFGVTVREIVILPIGGVARASREPTRLLHEVLIALAGPLVSLLIAFGLASVLAPRLGGNVPNKKNLFAEVDKLGQNALLIWMISANLMLALINLVPAFPMDGGRVLRALLSVWMGRQRATTIPAGIGQLLALGIAALGLTSLNPVLLLVGVFVFFWAGQEMVNSRAQEILAQLSAGEVCSSAALTLAPGDDLGDVVDHALRSNQALFPVIYGSDLIGVVLREDALAAAERVGLRGSVRQVLRRDLPVCEAATPLLEVRDRVVETGHPVVIVEGQRLVGILGAEDIARISRVSSRLVTAGIRRPVAPASEPNSAPRSAL